MKNWKTNDWILFLIFLIPVGTVLYTIHTWTQEDKKLLEQCKSTLAKAETIVMRESPPHDTLYAKCIEQIKYYEGLVLVPTHGLIGYGHLITRTDSFTVLSPYQADSLARADFDAHIAYVKILHPFIPNNQLYALAMLSYNIGVGRFTLYGFDKRVDTIVWRNAHYYKGKPHAGLLKRREFELKIFKGEAR